MPKRRKTIFNMAAVCHVEYSRMAVLVTWPVFCMRLYICCPNFAQIGQMTPKYKCSIWRPSAVLNLQNFDFFCHIGLSILEWKFASAYQIWSKSDNSWLRYGDKDIFKMAAVHHLDRRTLRFCDFFPSWLIILNFFSGSSNPWMDFHGLWLIRRVFAQGRSFGGCYNIGINLGVISQTPQNGAWIGNFKPNGPNIKIAIYCKV